MPTILEPRTRFPAGLIESYIGETVADAVCAISRALMEYCSGGVEAETKESAAELIARLYHLRQYSAAVYFNMSFDNTARDHGKIVLRERFGSDASEAALHEMISWPLDVLARLVRKHLGTSKNCFRCRSLAASE
jgi:hypothetical protein